MYQGDTSICLFQDWMISVFLLMAGWHHVGSTTIRGKDLGLEREGLSNVVTKEQDIARAEHTIARREKEKERLPAMELDEKAAAEAEAL